MVDNLLKESQKARQVDIMTSESDASISFLKICRVHVSREMVINFIITFIQQHEKFW